MSCMSLNHVTTEERIWLRGQIKDSRLGILQDYFQFFRDAEVFFTRILDLIPQAVIEELEEECQLLDQYHCLAYNTVVIRPESYFRLIRNYVKLKTEFHDKLLKELEFHGSQKQDNPEVQAAIGITAEFLWKLPSQLVGSGSVSE